jgi:crotonobetainyl-CoA:carnitine CoA-transferase CaiB-like acyl-CoA transferase
MATDELTRTLEHAVSRPLTTDEFDLHGALRDMLAEIGFAPEDAGGKITFEGLDPILPSTVRLGGAAALGLVQQSVVAARLWRMRGGRGQNIDIHLAKAIRRLAPVSELKWELLNGYPVSMADPTVIALFRFYETKDGRKVLPANLYSGLKTRLLALLDCADNPQALARAIHQWDAAALEQAAEERGIVMATVRTLDEFMKLPVYEYLAARPLIEIEKIGESAPEPLPARGYSPLAGIRALGMGHVIAGAGVGRSLASLGADVLNVWRLMEYEHEAVYASANVGTRSTILDVRREPGVSKLRELLGGADLFYANRRPGLLEKLGLSPEQAAALRPGIIHVTMSTHGQGGPWANRPGFDQVAGTVTGMVALEGTLDEPRLPPTSIVNDYLVGWLAATGAMAALARRATEGGSYRVHVSLDRAALWILSLGIFDKGYVEEVAGKPGPHELIDPEVFLASTPCGMYQGITETVHMSETPRHFATVLVPRGSSSPEWLPRLITEGFSLHLGLLAGGK